MNVYPFIEAEKLQQRNAKRACELLKSPVPSSTPIAPAVPHVASWTTTS